MYISHSHSEANQSHRFIVTVCNLTLTNQSGYITSPYYPGYFPSDVHCVWRIVVPEKFAIRLKILTFDLMEHVTCQQDFLQIKDVSKDTSISLGRFCGNKIPTILDSSSNLMEIEFQKKSLALKSVIKIFYFARQSK